MQQTPSSCALRIVRTTLGVRSMRCSSRLRCVSCGIHHHSSCSRLSVQSRRSFCRTSLALKCSNTPHFILRQGSVEDAECGREPASLSTRDIFISISARVTTIFVCQRSTYGDSAVRNLCCEHSLEGILTQFALVDASEVRQIRIVTAGVNRDR